MKDFMLQVLSNTGVITEWFLAAIRAPDWQLLQWTLQHEHFSRISLLAHTQLINCVYCTRWKKNKTSQFPAFSWKNCTRMWGQVKGLLFWALFQYQSWNCKTNQKILFMFKQTYKVRYCHLTCHYSNNRGSCNSFIRIYKSTSEKINPLQVK